MEVKDPVSYSIINSVPGLGFILSLTILYEIDDIHRFSSHGGIRYGDSVSDLKKSPELISWTSI